MPSPSEQRELRREAKVVVVGAGLSGLVAARDLSRSGVDVVVLEARDRVGGRVHELEREDGIPIMRGGEFTGPAQAQLQALAAEYGIEAEPLPPFVEDDDVGAFVRLFDGERFVETEPLSNDPPAAEAYQAAIDAIDDLAKRISPSEPWTSQAAADLDRSSLGLWLDQNVSNAAARAFIEGELGSFGDPYEVSMLYIVWSMARFGGWEAHAGTYTWRFVGGTTAIVRALVAELSDRVIVSSPVRRVDRSDGAVLVHTDRGPISASAAIFAIEPGQCAKIEFEPPLPAARDRLQIRWLAGHGAKIIATYDRPFWRDDGLVGVAFGPAPIQLAIDLSPTDGSEGILCALFFATSPSVGEHSDVLLDPERTKEMTLDCLETYFGAKVRSLKGFHAFDWGGDRWSDGCGSQVPPGVLSSLGFALCEPVGRLLWAGADAGEMDFMEGAVTAGQRAAREALALL